jgi:hypothetical protein
MVSTNKQSGGCTDRQKGIAAQLRTFTNHELREELNKIVHSGDSVGAKTHHPSNEYIDLSNNFDSKAEDIINRAIEYIKNNEKINHKQKNKILNGIVELNSRTNASTMHHKPTTTSVSTRFTPRKSFKDIAVTKNRTMTPNATVKFRRSRRSRSRSRRNRSRRSRRN